MYIQLQRQDSWSRTELLLRTFLGSIYFLPHIICLFFLGFAAQFIGLLNAMCILFSGRVLESFFSFICRFQAWSLRVSIRGFDLCDGYPEFGLNGCDPLLELRCEQPDLYNRSSVLLRLLFGWLLIFPHVFILYFLGIVAVFMHILAFFVILFTRSMPQSFFTFILGVLLWNIRVQNYFVYYIQDSYPSFTLQNERTISEDLWMR